MSLGTRAVGVVVVTELPLAEKRWSNFMIHIFLSQTQKTSICLIQLQ